MLNDLTQKLKYSYKGTEKANPLSGLLVDSLSIIDNFLNTKNNNKLCLVFPSKEFAAQWLVTPLTLRLIESDFYQYQQLIEKSISNYNVGDKIILNNVAILEWLGKSGNQFTFRHKEYKGTSKITIELKKISKIQPAPNNRNVLSSYQKVRKALSNQNKNPIDKILGIVSDGNKLYQKNSVCLIGRYKSYNDSTNDIILNNFPVLDYFEPSKVDENGIAEKSPLILSNCLSNLFCFLTSHYNISKILIDGFSIIKDSITDFHDIDSLNIPTILVTDLSEIENFELLGQFGFDVMFFSQNQINSETAILNSPFKKFERKLNTYKNLKIHREICLDEDLNEISQNIHAISKDLSNDELNSISFLLVKLINHLSRICYELSSDDYSELLATIDNIESLYLKSRFWLGESSQLIGRIIELLKNVTAKYKTNPSDKTLRLSHLLKNNQYDFIICRTNMEVKSITKSYLDEIQRNNTKIISFSEVNDDILKGKPQKAIITGWLRSNSLNQIINSFVFSELTVLFYSYENTYFNSLIRRNNNQAKWVNSTIKAKGIIPQNNQKTTKGFYESILSEEIIVSEESKSEYIDFEFKIENAQYSRYIVKRNSADSIKAKRVDFENDYFLYSTDTHRFLVLKRKTDSINDTQQLVLYKRKIDALKPGDIVAIINTDRDVLVDLVERNTNQNDLKAVKEWTDLWQHLLKDYYHSTGNDFKELVQGLRKYDCTKHEATIRSWITDDSKIGPEDNSDLISIALLTNSEKLLNNIDKVRDAIRKMTGWRMKASDIISKEIKSRINKIADDSIVNKKINIENLGSVLILKVFNLARTFEDVDIHHVNRLIRKEII